MVLYGSFMGDVGLFFVAALRAENSVSRSLLELYTALLWGIQDPFLGDVVLFYAGSGALLWHT